MKNFVKIILVVALFAAGWLAAGVSFGAPARSVTQGVPADVEPMPNIASETESDPTFFRKPNQRGDEGLKKILDDKFEVPRPNVFVGFRILLWGVTIAGMLLGLFIAVCIVVFMLRFIRKTAAPAITGVPDGTPLILQTFDNLRQKIENRKKELEAERAEIEKRTGSTQ